MMHAVEPRQGYDILAAARFGRLMQSQRAVLLLCELPPRFVKVGLQITSEAHLL